MYRLLRTDSQNQDFKNLVNLLDADLAVTDGDEHTFYDQFNKIDNIKFVIVVYNDNDPIACGAIKEFDPNTMEIKRMYVIPSSRSKGIASKVLLALEKWAVEMLYSRCVLETGIRQPDAVALYRKNGYKIIPNYGQYIGVANSLCFEKIL